MKHKFFLLSLFLLLMGEARSQTDSSFSLKQCIDYALENATIVQNAKLDEYISKGKIGEVRAAGLPQIAANGNITYNPLLQRQFFDASNPFLKSFLGDSNARGVISSPNLFQLKTSGIASATINQLLFSGTYLVATKSAKTYRQLAEKSLTQSKIQTVENVTKAYYLVLITRERLQLLYANVARLDTSLRQTRTMQENGLAEKIDVDRAEVSFNNILTDVKKTENQYALLFAALKFQMGMPFEKPLNLSGSIADLNDQIKAIQQTKITDYNQRIEYSSLQTNKQLNYWQLRAVRAEYLPTLSLTGTAGYFRMDRSVSQLLQNEWFPYTNYGLNVNLPIFDGLSKHYRSQQAKLEIKKTENNIANLKNSIDLEIQQSGTTLNNNIKALESQKRNLELSTEVARISRIKYQEGVGSNLEVTSAETALKESQTNYYNSLYDLIISNVDYQKSLGLLTY